MLLLPQHSSLGGVKMKRAEAITMSLTESDVFPAYHCLPRPSSLLHMKSLRIEAPGRDRIVEVLSEGGIRWDEVPPHADPASAMPAKRRQRKREQVESMVRCCAAIMLALAPRDGGSDSAGKHTFVDFCGGAGHVSLLMAWLFPSWSVVCIDLKERHLELASQRARELGLDNFRTWRGDVRDFPEGFTLGSALHACGSATDFSISRCISAGACMVVCPCCVGKLASDKEIRSDGPRSVLFKERLAALGQDSFDPYDELVKAGDFGDNVLGDAGWWRRAAKSLLEADRMAHIHESQMIEESQTASGTSRLAAGESRSSVKCENDDGGQGHAHAHAHGGYRVRLIKMEPLTATPKNDIIVAWPAAASSRSTAGQALPQDALQSLEHVFGQKDARTYHLPEDHKVIVNGADRHEPTVEQKRQASPGVCPVYLGDFVRDEAFVSLQRRIATFHDTDGERELLIEGLRGNRERKMAHAIAESLALAHRSQGQGVARCVRVWKTC